MTMSRKFHRLRRLLGAALLLLFTALPFVRVQGESALRFDVPSLRLLFFGTSIWMADFFIILIATLFLTFAAILATTLFGRVWCGWLCPQTILVDATGFMDSAGKKQHGVGLIVRFIGGILVSMVAAASLIGYFVSPYDLLMLIRTGATAGKIATGSFIALCIIIFLDLIALRRVLCATACPYAKMQGVLFDDRTLRVAFDARRSDECMHCNACTTTCPVGIDIRKGLAMECIHCAECVDACTGRMAQRGRSSLVNYSFGAPGERGSNMRLIPLFTAGVALTSLAMLLYLSATRMPFDMTVRLDYATPPALHGDGSITNTFELSLRNMSGSELPLALSVSAPMGKAMVEPAEIMLPKAKEMTHTRVSVTLPRVTGKEPQSPKITLTLRSEQLDKDLSKTVFFIIPHNE